MTKPRYNLYLTGTTTGGATNNTYTFNVDLKTLLPFSERKRQFMVYSSFDVVEDFGTTAIGGLQVYSDIFSKRYKKDYTIDATLSKYILMGVATPRLCYSTTDYTYSYKQNQCNPFVFEYPDSNYSPIITIYLKTNSANNIIADNDWILCMSFEEI